MPRNSVEFGLGAPSIKEQHPALNDLEASHFDKDAAAIIRLSVRGLITEAQKHSAFRRLTKNIERSIRSELKKQT